MSLTDDELSLIFQRETTDCTILCNGLLEPECLEPHYTGWEVLHVSIGFTVCHNALAAFEVAMRKEGRLLHCLCCGQWKGYCKCGYKRAVYVVQEDGEKELDDVFGSQEAAGRVPVEGVRVSRVQGTAGVPVRGQEGDTDPEHEASAEGPALREDPACKVEEIDDVFGTD